MAQAESGDTVKIHYTGTLEDGSQFDSSYDRDEPLEFQLGSGQMIPGFEKAVMGMEPGDSKVVKIPSEHAYGPVNPNQIVEVPRSQMPEGLEIRKGMQLQGKSPDGKTLLLVVADMSESTVTLDGNHPLAGKDLTFDIELVGIS